MDTDCRKGDGYEVDIKKHVYLKKRLKLISLGNIYPLCLASKILR